MKKIFYILSFLFIFMTNVYAESSFTIDAKVIDKNGIKISYYDENEKEKNTTIPYGTIVSIYNEVNNYNEFVFDIMYNGIEGRSIKASQLTLLDGNFDYNAKWGKMKEMSIYIADNTTCNREDCNNFNYRVNIYEYPSLLSKIIYDKGIDAKTVLKTSYYGSYNGDREGNRWAYIEYKGIKGYILLDLLDGSCSGKAYLPIATGVDYTIISTGGYIYDSYGYDGTGKKVMEVPMNAKVNVKYELKIGSCGEYNDSMLYVTYNGKSGWYKEANQFSNDYNLAGFKVNQKIYTGSEITLYKIMNGECSNNNCVTIPKYSQLIFLSGTGTNETAYVEYNGVKGFTDVILGFYGSVDEMKNDLGLKDSDLPNYNKNVKKDTDLPEENIETKMDTELPEDNKGTKTDTELETPENEIENVVEDNSNKILGLDGNIFIIILSVVLGIIALSIIVFVIIKNNKLKSVK